MKREKTLAAIVGAVVGAAGLAITAPAAHAGPNCGTPHNGFDVSAVVRQATRTHDTDAGRRTVTVRLLNGRAFDESRATISSGYRRSDLVWVDRSYNGGATWTQCGPFNSRTSNELKNLGNWMRACMATKKNGVSNSFCTSWYYDAD
ncbi:hypothetical protein [Sinosporangium siamense]|uniref:Secreted protein n=1 Tax=Sinosporangium siamense TaxID=1367973 RepID=A0A919VBG1_9ACTN|nr:hypothetical protein [Sinosporangium siamense]GII96482.1 hypothetical protein Ssi02_67130 [Sinosporangium siamense]